MISVLVAVLWWWGMAAAACGLFVLVVLVAYGIRERRARRVTLEALDAELDRILSGV